MTVFERCPLALVLALCGPLLLAQGAPNGSDKLLQTFYAKLIALAKGGEDKPEKSSIQVCLSVPGLVLTPMDSKNEDDVRYINALFDVVNKPGPTWVPSGSFISTIYGIILENKVIAAAQPLDQATANQLQKAQTVLDPGGDTMKKYYQLQDALVQAKSAMNLEKYENLAKGKGAIVSPEKRLAFDRANSTFNNSGLPSLVSDSETIMKQILSRTQSGFWTQASRDFDAAMTEDHPQIDTFPRMETWATDDGWVSFSCTVSESSGSSQLSAKDAKLAASVKVDGLKVQGKAGYASELSKAMAADKDLSLSLQVKRVFLQRGKWFKREILDDGKWVWNQAKRGTVISSGKLLRGDQPGPTEQMPEIVDSFLIVRKVVFKSKAFDAYQEEMNRDLAAGVDISYGPIKIGGGYAQHNEKKMHDVKIEKGTLTIRNLQIVAYICKPIGKCPEDPDKTAP